MTEQEKAAFEAMREERDALSEDISAISDLALQWTLGAETAETICKRIVNVLANAEISLAADQLAARDKRVGAKRAAEEMKSHFFRMTYEDDFETYNKRIAALELEAKG